MTKITELSDLSTEIGLRFVKKKKKKKNQQKTKAQYIY